MKNKILSGFALSLIILMTIATSATSSFADGHLEHKFAENNGVKIHYAAMGKGPLVVFIHGFPDFWFSWQHQMNGLKGSFRVAALDTRGYNESDKPTKQEDYDMRFLINDVAAVIKAEGREKAVIVGHDWGGAIAWQFVMAMPHMAEKLIIVNLPHPKGIARELANNKEQQTNSQYARNFQKPDSHKNINPQLLASMVARGDEVKKAKYVEAFNKSSTNGMMNYYRQNYPRTTGESVPRQAPVMPNVTVPVLQFHGLNDTALHANGLNNTWDWLEQDYTLVTIPNVGHWAHHEAADLVTDTMLWWLNMRK